MKKHLRIAAQQCNFYTREETLKLPELWKEFHFNTEQLFHTHADMYSALYDEALHKDLVVEYMKNAKANNIDIIVYMNCHILGPSIADRKDWSVIDKNGNYPLSYDTYPACCLNSTWRDYFFECVEKLREFDIIGLFFDGPHYDNCYCPVCQKEFEKLYGKKMTDASDAELNRFAYETTMRFKEDLYRKVKSVNPAWQMYFNEGLMHVRYNKESFARQLATNDIIGTEGGFFFYCEPRKTNEWRCAASAKVAEAVANGRPTVIFFAGDQKPWSWYLHTPAETALCYMSSIGNGASVWYGLHCTPDNYRSETGNMIKKLLAFDEKYDELYQNSVSAADIAVFFSYDTAGQYKSQSEISDLYGDTGNTNDYPGDYNAVHGAFGMLSHLNRAYDVVTEFNLQDLKRYKVLIAPLLAMVSDETRDAIAEFVANGGTVIADGEFGIYNEKGIRRERGAFAETAGFDYTGRYIDHKRFNFCSFQDFYAADNQNNFLPAPEWSAEIVPAEGTEVFGTYSPVLDGRYAARPQKATLPLAIKKSYGKGTFYYIAGGAFEFYYDFTDVTWRNVIGKLIDQHSANDYVLHNATTGVAMTVRDTQCGSKLVHLTNYTSSTRPIEKSAVLTGLVLEVPASVTRAVNLWSGTDLTMIAPGKFALDPLAEVAVIKLD